MKERRGLPRPARSPKKWVKGSRQTTDSLYCLYFRKWMLFLSRSSGSTLLVGSVRVLGAGHLCPGYRLGPPWTISPLSSSPQGLLRVTKQPQRRKHVGPFSGGGGCQTCQVVLSGPVELISNSFVTLIFYTDLQFLCKGKWTTLGVLLQRPLVSECVILSIPRIEEFEAKSSVHVGFLLIWAKMVSNSSSRKDLILKKWEQRFCDDWQPSLTDILPMGQN